MSFIEIIFIFISFCLIHSAFDLFKDYTKARMMKNTVKNTVSETVDVALGTAFRSILNYKNIKNEQRLYPSYVDQEEEEVKNDEVSNMQ